MTDSAASNLPPSPRPTGASVLQKIEPARDPVHVLADALPQLVWITWPDGLTDYFNRHWIEYTGLSLEESRGEGWSRLLHPDDMQRTLDRWKLSIDTGEPYDIEYRLKNTATNEFRWFLGRGLPYRDEAGNIVRWFGTCTDIHDQKLAHEALHAAKAQSDAAHKSRDEFLSVLSHELRTPLSAIIGWVQLLQMGALDETERNDALKTINEQAKLQAQLVEDMLEVSRIINGKFRIRDEAVELPRAVQAAIDAVLPTAIQKNLSLDFTNIDPPVYVRGDAQRLQQMTWNLLTNAVKFTPDGGAITVSLHRHQSAVTLTVADTGRGIPCDMLTKIFDRFQQAEGGASRPHGGLGLGLAIVQHIVDLHGGTIEAESEGLGRGCRFTVRLPVHAICPDATPQTPTGQTISNNALRGLKLLVVDDDNSARQVVAAVLRNYGAEVFVARAATEAIQMLNDQSFSALISDISMPVVNGFDLIRLVRQQPGDSGRIRAMALSACATSEDQAASIQAGFDCHLSKPVEPIKLVLSVMQLMQNYR